MPATNSAPYWLGFQVKLSAAEVVDEQLSWWKASGIEPMDAFAALGMMWPMKRAPLWFEVALAADVKWRGLRLPAGRH